jgi:hypothetical protein
MTDQYTCSVCGKTEAQLRKARKAAFPMMKRSTGVLGRCAKCGKDFCMLHEMKHVSEGACKQKPPEEPE